MELTPISTHFRNYNSSDQQLRKKDQDDWLDVFNSLQKLIWQLATWAVDEGSLSTEYSHQYLMSGRDAVFLIMYCHLTISSQFNYCLCNIYMISKDV